MLIAAEIPDEATVVDTYEPLGLADYLQLAALGFHSVLRYVDNLTAKEVGWATEDAKMGMMLVRTCRKRDWLPTALIGTSDGQMIAKAAASLSFPKGVSSWLDDEGPGGSGADEIAYLNAAFAEMGFCLPGPYIGDGTRMTSDQLFHDLTCVRYMKSASSVPDVAVRGYCLIQESPLDRTLPGLPGKTFDVSVARADRLGGRAVCAIAA